MKTIADLTTSKEHKLKEEEKVDTVAGANLTIAVQLLLQRKISSVKKAFTFTQHLINAYTNHLKVENLQEVLVMLAGWLPMTILRTPCSHEHILNRAHTCRHWSTPNSITCNLHKTHG